MEGIQPRFVPSEINDTNIYDCPTRTSRGQALYVTATLTFLLSSLQGGDIVSVTDTVAGG